MVVDVHFDKRSSWYLLVKISLADDFYLNENVLEEKKFGQVEPDEDYNSKESSNVLQEKLTRLKSRAKEVINNEKRRKGKVKELMLMLMFIIISLNNLEATLG